MKAEIAIILGIGLVGGILAFTAQSIIEVRKRYHVPIHRQLEDPLLGMKHCIYQVYQSHECPDQSFEAFDLCMKEKC